MGTRGTPGSKSTSKSSEKYACVLAIRKGAWAERKVEGYGLLAEETAAAFILAEHRRAVRAVKRQLDIYQRQREVEKDERKRDLLAGSIFACVDLLESLQRGRE